MGQKSIKKIKSIISKLIVLCGMIAIGFLAILNNNVDVKAEGEYQLTIRIKTLTTTAYNVNLTGVTVTVDGTSEYLTTNSSVTINTSTFDTVFTLKIEGIKSGNTLNLSTTSAPVGKDRSLTLNNGEPSGSVYHQNATVTYTAMYSNTAKASIANYKYGETPSEPIITNNLGNGNVTIGYEEYTTNINPNDPLQNTPPTEVGHYYMVVTIDETSYVAGKGLYCSFYVTKGTHQLLVSYNISLMMVRGQQIYQPLPKLVITLFIIKLSVMNIMRMSPKKASRLR